MSMLNFLKLWRPLQASDNIFFTCFLLLLLLLLLLLSSFYMYVIIIQSHSFTYEEGPETPTFIVSVYNFLPLGDAHLVFCFICFIF